jgi:hypothetical protein
MRRLPFQGSLIFDTTEFDLVNAYPEHLDLNKSSSVWAGIQAGGGLSGSVLPEVSSVYPVRPVLSSARHAENANLRGTSAEPDSSTSGLAC